MRGRRPPFDGARRHWAGLLVLLALACRPVPGSGDDTPARCRAESLGSVRAFLEAGAPATNTFDATLEAAPKPGDGGLWKLALREASGATHTLTLISPVGAPHLEVGARYRIRVDYAPGYPPASGLLIWKEGELIYAAAGDPSPERRVLGEGVPGFEIARLPSRCANRGPTDCFDALRSAPLRIAHAGATVTLMQGESADLGGYRVTCLTAEEITYSARCADAGRVTLSYVIERR
ncbi:MAG TPA: hypothetical protein VMQ62_06045 [Dongiaceae bacterium]|nr:hypothetical protein [Dongiaceae bacterium]